MYNDKTLPVNMRFDHGSANSQPYSNMQNASMQPGGSNQSALCKAYEELGRAYYTYRFEEPTPELIQMFDRITRLENAAAQSQNAPANRTPVNAAPAQMNVNAGNAPAGMYNQAPQTRRCPKCGTPVGNDSIYCGVCGSRLV